VQRRTSVTAQRGTVVAIRDYAPTTDRHNLTICEILPALGGATYTVSGTVTPAAVAGQTTVRLGGAASATVTPDSTGKFSFTV